MQLDLTPRASKPAERFGRFFAPSTFLALSVDSARVVAHEHWLSDVLAGDVLGTPCVPAVNLLRG